MNKNMIQEDYVTFKQAKLLKEKGFPQEWYQQAVYFTSTKQNQKIGNFKFMEGEDVYEAEYSDWIVAPTLAVVQKWILQTFKIYLSVSVDISGQWNCGIILFNYEKMQTWDTIQYLLPFTSPEKALSAGIDKALELI